MVQVPNDTEKQRHEEDPTSFVRDAENMARVTDEIADGCDWVVAGEGVATRKIDGTSCLFDGEAWWKRREVKAGKAPPPDFREETHDETTGKRTGWVPVDGSDKWHLEAIDAARLERDREGDRPPRGTYELVGPKVQGNPEHRGAHTLVRHESAERMNAPRTFDELRDWLEERDIEGIVWHHPDGRMAKIKLRDFGFERVVAGTDGEAGRAPA